MGPINKKYIESVVKHFLLAQIKPELQSVCFESTDAAAAGCAAILCRELRAAGNEVLKTILKKVDFVSYADNKDLFGIEARWAKSQKLIARIVIDQK